MWHRAECAISMVESEVNLSQLGKRIQGIINNSDSFAAKKMLQRFGIHIGAFEGIYCAS
jgi:FMN phosphatase YigB (HAD superfamily)